MKAEDSSSSLIPVLGRGLNSSSTIEVTVAPNKRRRDEYDELELI